MAGGGGKLFFLKWEKENVDTFWGFLVFLFFLNKIHQQTLLKSLILSVDL